MNKTTKYRIVAWTVALFLIILLPSGINASSQIQVISIATAIGLDKSEDGVEVSVQIIVPQPSTNYSPKYLIASATGKNLPEAIQNTELKVGQEIGLAHCFVIVLGDELCNENLADTLDFLMRSNIMGNNTALIHTDKTAKKLLEESSKLSESDINNLQNIAKYNQEHYSSSNTDLISFFNNYMSKSPFSLIGSVSIEEETTNNNQNSSQPQGQEEKQNSNSDQEKPKVLKNEGKAIVVKKGKKIAELDKEDLTKFGWLDQKSQKGFLIIKNVTNEIFEDATITLHIKNESISLNAKLTNNIPVAKVNIFFEAFIESIENDGKTMAVHENYCSPSLQEIIEKEIKSQINDALSLSKEKNFDIVNFYQAFNSNNPKEWKNYLKTLQNPEDYIQNIEIVTNISMHHKL